MVERGQPRTSTVRTARSRRTRAALVDAIRRELHSSGSFDADRVAARANCSPATFYSHFATKDNALAEAFAAVLEELLERSADLLTIERLQEVGLDKAFVDIVECDADFFRSETLVFRAALAGLPRHRSLRDAYRNAEAAHLARLQSLITTGQELGLIRMGPVDTLAETVMVLSQGVNNPRALRGENAAIRVEIASAIASVLRPTPEGEARE